MKPTNPSLILLALIMCLASVLSLPSLGADQVPITGNCTGKVKVTLLSESESLFRMDNVGVGHVSHLGRTTAAWAVPRVKLDLVTRQLTVTNAPWTGTLTAANGDQIFGEYTFLSDTIPFTPRGDISFAAALKVTGGTGRFANASGEVLSFGKANIFTMMFSIEFSGTLSSPGSAKKN